MGGRKSGSEIYGYYNNTKIANHIRSVANSPETARKSYVGDRICRIRVGDADKSAQRTEAPEGYWVAFSLTDVLSMTDCVILDAATAFYAASQRGADCAEFSAADLAEFMYGSAKARRKDVGAALDRLCGIEIAIEISEEVKMRLGSNNEPDRYLEDIGDMANLVQKDGDYSEGMTLKGPLLPLERIKVKNSKYRYRFAQGKVPVLYEYASAVNSQYKTYSPLLLKELEADGGETLNTERVLLERYYLIGRLELLRYFLSQKRFDKFKRSETIGFGKEDKPMNILLYLTWEREQVWAWSKTQLSHSRNRVFEEVKKLLEYFKQIGYIKDYRAEKSRGECAVTLEKGIKNPIKLR